MNKTIFRRIAWIILLIVLLSDAALLAVSYRIAYNNSYETCVNQLENASGILEDWLVYFEVTDEESYGVLSTSLNHFCEHLDMPYMYILKVNREEQSIEYVAIGFGADATQEAKQALHPGTKKTVDMPVEITEAMEQPGRQTIEHLKNEYDDTLICYLAVHRNIDVATGISKEIKVPYVIGVELSLSKVMLDIKKTFDVMTVLLVVLSVVIAGSVAFLIYRMVSRPARMISRRMSSFVEDYNQGIQPLPVKGGDEFAEMSRSFNTMAENISGYIDNIEELNREKHTRQAELDIAGNIQLGLLAKPHFRKPQFEIHACMFPAKDVGGDLYDYLVLEDGKVFLAVADVSGKGITASLFMSRAVTLLHLYAKMGYSPAQILKEYNNTLSAQNSGGLFITTFVAVYDPETRYLTYSNGGHNIPYVLSNRLILLDGAQSIAAGLFGDEEYEEARIRLKPGDCVFMYTDGVNEAQNKRGELFTTERLERELSDLFRQSAEQVVRTVRAHVLDFTGDAEQSDDITMLAFQPTSIDWKKQESKEEASGVSKSTEPGSDESESGVPKPTAPGHYHRVYHLTSDPGQMSVLREAVSEIPGVSDELRMNLMVIMDEIFANICSYGYEDKQEDDRKKGSVDVTIDVTDRLVLIFEDDGKPFDPTEELPDIETFDHMNTIGGLGRFITFELTDSHSYEYKDGKNILRLEKML